jgi:hypothetical protein
VALRIVLPDWLCNLVDLRIDDITVVADPNRGLPAAPEPVEADGTINGLVSDPDH